MPESLRVCHIIDQLATGGAEWLLPTAAAQGRATGVEHHVVSLTSAATSPVTDALDRLAVPMVCVPSTRSQQMLDRARLHRLVGAVSRIQPDVIHLHLEMSTVLGAMVARRLGLPAVVTLHGSAPELGANGWIKLPLLRRALRRADTVIAVGPTVARTWAASVPGIEPVVVANPVPPRVSGRSGHNQTPRLLSVGRLVEAKAFPVLVAAMDEVHRRYPATDLRIAGEGPTRPQIEAEIAAQGLGTVVSLLGQRPDVGELLASADVFVSSSSIEGMPLAILEAMSAGLPVVATAVGDIPTTVPTEAGIIVPPLQPAPLADAICRMIEEPDLRRRCGEAGRRHVAEHHHPAGWGRRLSSIYRRSTGRIDRVAS